jgi:hypothetical protein
MEMQNGIEVISEDASQECNEWQRAMAAEGEDGVSSEDEISDFDDEIHPMIVFPRGVLPFCPMRTLGDWCNPSSLYMVTPTYAFLLTCRALYSRCVADCLLAVARIQVTASHLIEFYVKICSRNRYLVQHVDIGRLSGIIEGMTIEANVGSCNIHSFGPRTRLPGGANFQ